MIKKMLGLAVEAVSFIDHKGYIFHFQDYLNFNVMLC